MAVTRRAKNEHIHPGLVDTKRKRCSPEEVAAEKAAKEEKKLLAVTSRKTRQEQLVAVEGEIRQAQKEAQASSSMLVVSSSKAKASRPQPKPSQTKKGKEKQWVLSDDEPDVVPEQLVRLTIYIFSLADANVISSLITAART